LVFLAGCASPSSSSGSRSSSRPATPISAPASVSGSTSRNTPKIERGQASFYGGKYHGRKTASGEIFDKNALTAAHQWLAFGTRVRVTSLENKKNVVVRINDRFPGTKGRLIDLSEGAFLRLSPLAKGVIPVQVEVLR